MNYFKQKKEAERADGSKLYQPAIEDINIKVPYLWLIDCDEKLIIIYNFST